MERFGKCLVSTICALFVASWAGCLLVHGESLSMFPLGSSASDVSFNLGSGKSVSLSEYFEHKRIILLYVPTELNSEAEGYLGHFAKLQMALTERDVVVVALVDVGSPLLQKNYGDNILIASQSDRVATSSSPNTDPAPLLILIGKDRTVKLRERQFVPANAIFATIDAMPMRKEEMKRQRHEAH